jgi:hypothetical protein
VAIKVAELSEPPKSICKALLHEIEALLQVFGHCHHVCQYIGAAIMANKLCLVMKRWVMG